jgi:hypothetical protein
VLLVTATEGLLHVSRHSDNCSPFELPFLMWMVIQDMCLYACVTLNVCQHQLTYEILTNMSLTVISSPVEQERKSGDDEICILEALSIRPWVYYIYSSSVCARICSTEMKRRTILPCCHL